MVTIRNEKKKSHRISKTILITMRILLSWRIASRRRRKMRQLANVSIFGACAKKVYVSHINFGSKYNLINVFFLSFYMCGVKKSAIVRNDIILNRLGNFFFCWWHPNLAYLIWSYIGTFCRSKGVIFFYIGTNVFIEVADPRFFSIL